MDSGSDIRIGISGWRYAPWRGNFYPKGLAQRRELEYASRQVNSIEINGTFYSLQRASSFEHWHDQTPDDFVFAIKGNRYITHLDRLKNPKPPLANFFASGLLRLGKKLGPFLWQFSPSFRYDRAALDRFFRLLPRNTAEAAKLARSHEAKLADASLKSDDEIPLRHAIEIRHRSFENEEFIALLREHDIAIVVADTAGKWPVIEDVTAGFLYLRLHGDQKIYESGYTPEAIDDWARKIHRWSEGGNPKGARLVSPGEAMKVTPRDVFVYFDNDVKTHAPFDAISLGSHLGLAPREFEPES